MLLTVIERPTRLSPNSSLPPWQKERSYEVSFIHSFHGTVFHGARFLSTNGSHFDKARIDRPAPRGQERMEGLMRAADHAVYAPTMRRRRERVTTCA